MLKFILLALILIENEVRALNCELEKYDEFEEIVNYFRLRNYALGRELDGHMYPQNSVSEFKQLLEEKLNCKYENLESLLSTAFKYCRYSQSLLNEISEKLFKEVIDEKSCELKPNFSETRFRYAEPFMEEMLNEDEKMITNYLSFQKALDDLEVIYMDFKLVYSDDARVKYVQNLIYSIKRQSVDSRESINEEIEQIQKENIEIQKWLQNRFLRQLLQCYAKSEHALHPEQDENVTELKPLPPNPSIDLSKPKFGVVFLSLFAIVFFGSMIIYSTIFLIKPSLIRVPRFFQRQGLELK